MQNRELQQILLLGTHNDKDIRRYLEEHRIHVAAQIQKLKILKVITRSLYHANIFKINVFLGIP